MASTFVRDVELYVDARGRSAVRDELRRIERNCKGG